MRQMSQGQSDTKLAQEVEATDSSAIHSTRFWFRHAGRRLDAVKISYIHSTVIVNTIRHAADVNRPSAHRHISDFF